MGLVHVWEDERDKPNIQITHQDRRSPHVLHGYRNDDPKIKIVKVDVSIPRPQNYLQIRQGEKVYEQEANSPVRNFYVRCLCMLCGVTNLIDAGFNIRKQDGTLDSVNNSIAKISAAAEVNIHIVGDYGYCANVNSDSYGIAVGSGNTAWTLDNYMPETLIQQGTTTGKLVYSATPSPIISYSGGVWTVLGRRVFDNFNADGNTITVKEVVQFVPNFSSSTFKYIYIDERTVLGTPKDIPYKSGAIFTYTRTLPTDINSGMTSNAYAILLMHAFAVNNHESLTVYGEGYRSVRTIGGGTFYSTNLVGGYMGIGNQNHYCVAGYGNTAVTFNDYNLKSQFASGTGINKLVHQTQNTPSAVYDSPSKTFTVTRSRTLTNGYGSSQDVKEIGMTGEYSATNDPAATYLMSRVVLGSPVALAQNESIAIIYDFNMIHP